ncbi:MAG TPA: E2/UBC family protein [Blastocatellia bacterium]|nr:E2/UBC family protein [Blastocatellia bacterium]
MERQNSVVLDAEDNEINDDELQKILSEAKDHGKPPASFSHRKVRLGIRELPGGDEKHFRAALTDTLLEVFEQGAQVLGKPLLPPAPAEPKDYLRCRERHGHDWSEPLTELSQPLWLALAHGCSRHFGIEYRLLIKINVKWDVAPSPNATPRQLLTSFGFDPAQFSLYRADSAAFLPPDTPLQIRRGDLFEAQADGKYGDTGKRPRPSRGSQTIEDDVEELKEAGVDARLLVIGGQKYVEVQGLLVPSPPWTPCEVSILIAVPATYPTGFLDAFYIEATARHQSGTIPREQSRHNFDGRWWILVSWHYADHRPWNPRQDDLSTHVEHCRGFFLQRGVK